MVKYFEFNKKEELAMIEVDVRGFSCPIPVVRTKKAIDGNPDQPITVLVETAVSKENVTRLAKSKNYSIQVEEVAGEEYKVLLNPPEK
jgi:tRNA 2-thiouridine synthesizing protein A